MQVRSKDTAIYVTSASELSISNFSEDEKSLLNLFVNSVSGFAKISVIIFDDAITKQVIPQSGDIASKVTIIDSSSGDNRKKRAVQNGKTAVVELEYNITDAIQKSSVKYNKVSFLL